MVILRKVEPFAYQKSTALDERNQLADKVNEVIGELNKVGDVPENIGPRFDQLESDVENVSASLAGINETDARQDLDIQHSKDDIASINGDIVAINSDVDGINKTLANTGLDIADIKKKNIDQDADIGHLTDDITMLNTDIVDINGSLAGTVTAGAVITDEAKGTLTLDTANGKVSSDVPIASSTKTGLMNSQTFKGLEDARLRIDALERKATSAYCTFPNPTPSNDEITASFTQSTGRAPRAGDYAIDLSKGLEYGYDGLNWFKINKIPVQLFSAGQPGIIKGGDDQTPGTVTAEPDGTGSVAGWDTVSQRASTAVASLKREATDNMVSVVYTRQDGTEGRFNIDPVGNDKAGTITPAQYAKLTKTTGDYEITGRYDFKLSPFVPVVKPNELDSLRVAPVSQIHEAFVNADKKSNEIDGKVTALTGTVNSVSDRVTAIGVTNEIGGTEEAPTLMTTVNGKTSSVNLPAGGGGFKDTPITNNVELADALRNMKLGDEILGALISQQGYEYYPVYIKVVDVMNDNTKRLVVGGCLSKYGQQYSPWYMTGGEVNAGYTDLNLDAFNRFQNTTFGVHLADSIKIKNLVVRNY